MWQQYVSVSAVANWDQMWACSDLAGYVLPNRQMLALGIQVTDETLRGEPGKNPAIYPSVERLPQLLALGFHGIEPHIHFSPNGREGLLDKLKRLAELSQKAYLGLQINQSRIDLQSLCWWRETFPEGRLILPVTPKMVTRCKDSPEAVYQEFCSYEGLVTDLLFDLSGGCGEPMNSEVAARYLTVFRERWPELRLGVAGGLGPLTMQPLVDLLRKGFWPLSWDAQSQLCLPDGGLDMRRVALYAHLSADARYLAGM